MAPSYAPDKRETVEVTLSYKVAHSNDVDLGHIEVKTLTVAAGDRGARFFPVASMGACCGFIIEVKPTYTGHFAGPKRDMTLVQTKQTGDV